jgi:hypothetical protein
LADLAVAREGFERALQPGQPNVFSWHDETFWADRARRFVIPGASSSRINEGSWGSHDTLPSGDEEAKGLIDLYAGEHQLEPWPSSIDFPSTGLYDEA